MPKLSRHAGVKRNKTLIKDEDFAINKAAYDALLHHDESTAEYEDSRPRGIYHSVRSGSKVAAMDYAKLSGGARSGAQTTPQDLCIAVDNVIRKRIKTKKDLQMVRQCCILGLLDSTDYKPYDRKRLSNLEQTLGKAFIKAGLYPVEKFFKCVRKKRKV